MQKGQAAQVHRGGTEAAYTVKPAPMAVLGRHSAEEPSKEVDCDTQTFVLAHEGRLWGPWKVGLAPHKPPSGLTLLFSPFHHFSPQSHKLGPPIPYLFPFIASYLPHFCFYKLFVIVLLW